MPYPKKHIKLTDEERLIVIAQLAVYQKEGKWKKRKRLQILYWSDQGRGIRAIMGSTGFSYATVRRWLYRYEKEGLKPFLSYPDMGDKEIPEGKTPKK